MKRFALLLLLSLLMAAFTGVFAQSYKKYIPERDYKKGRTDLTFLTGVLPTFLMDGAKINIPPMSVGVERMLSENISIGVQMGHSSSTTRNESVFEESKRYRNSFYFVGIRSAAHCNCRMDNLDIYGGAMLGYNLSLISVENGSFGELEEHLGIKEKEGKVTYSAFLGVRYACSKKLTLVGEFGYGISIIQLGFGYQI
ncbi:MAG: hypothetical protein AAB316_03860 [Bacteroidota bacterium]|mgnify:CR=1 FL=1